MTNFIATTQQHPKSATITNGRKAVIAGTVGHILEWYDFAAYGYVALYIAANFFPSQDKTVSLLATLAAFGVGFVARPLGGVVFGRAGDKLGRRAVLLTTLLIMAGATLVMGLLPTYATIGLAAPIILVAARLLQGFSAGGESTTAAAFIVEWAPNGRRGFWGSFFQMASGIGLLIGSLVVAGLTTLLSPQEMQEWGWRIPFLLGALLAPVAFLVRRAAQETPQFARLAEEPEATEQADFQGKVLRIAQAFLLALFWCVGFYFFLSYMPTYAIRELKLEVATVFWLSSLASLAFIIATPIFGAASDIYGRKKMLLLSCAAFAISAVPAFTYLTHNPNPGNYFAIVTVTGLIFSMYTGPAGAALSELFPTKTRSSGMAIGYNISAVVFGGFTPFIATWLIKTFETPLAPIYYVAASAFVGGIFVLSMKETAHNPLE